MHWMSRLIAIRLCKEAGCFRLRSIFCCRNIYRQAASDDPRGYLYYTDKQNVSEDIIGTPLVAAVIEGHETHTRTANVTIDLKNAPGLEKDIISSLKDTVVSIPVTQAVIYGWYDNEMASYVTLLGDRIVSIAENM